MCLTVCIINTYQSISHARGISTLSSALNDTYINTSNNSSWEVNTTQKDWFMCCARQISNQPKQPKTTQTRTDPRWWLHIMLTIHALQTLGHAQSCLNCIRELSWPSTINSAPDWPKSLTCVASLPQKTCIPASESQEKHIVSFYTHYRDHKFTLIPTNTLQYSALDE